MGPIEIILYYILLSAIIILIIGSGFTFFIAHFKREKRELCGIISLVFIAISAIGIIYVSGMVFANGFESVKGSLFTVPGIGATFSIRIDNLSAIFLCIIGLISILTTLYSIKFMAIPYYKDSNLVGYYPPLLLYFASLIVVVSVNDMFFFFIAWEFMTLSSYTLVIFDRKQKERLRAGFKYFLMTHIATACMFLAAIILYTYGEKSFNFDSLSLSIKGLMVTNPVLVHVVLGLFFVGFATKAGILPFGDWLPDAYPAAPSSASSIFGGTMSKLGVYGIIRVFCDILPISGFSSTWGIVIAIFGTGTIFLGTMTALYQDDTKRLLSFLHIGQIGYMFLGIGIGVYFLPINKFIASVAIVGGIFHIVNHALYKSTLFLGAGSIFYKTGTRDLNKIGGLSKIMLITTFTTIIASLSIAGIPPFNGFSSKWLIYQASVFSGITNPSFVGSLFVALGIIAIFISGVTLASFFKFFGSSFFGKLHEEGERLEKGDVPKEMLIPQVILAALCVLIGIFPVLVIKIIHKAVSGILETGFTPLFSDIYGNSIIGINLNFGTGIFSNWNPFIIVIALAVTLLISYFFYKSGKVKERVADTWYCGEEHTDEETRYKAHSFYMPFKQFFKIRIGKYYKEGVYPTIPLPRITLSERSLLKRILEVDRWFFYPIVDLTLKILRKFSKTHVGIPHVYLLWMFLGLAIGIVILFLLT